MIIILNGSVGVGKTATSWELNTKFYKSVMLDGDYLGAVHPFEIYDQERTNHLYQTFEHLIKFHQANGYHHAIINYVFETPQELSRLVDKLLPIDSEVHSFWLTCLPDEQEKRIWNRNTDQIQWELNRFRELNQILENSALKGYIGTRMDTSGLSISEVVEQILLKVL